MPPDMNTDVTLTGEIARWPSQAALADILRAGGLLIDVGRYAIALTEMEHFKFEELGGDLGDPVIYADASSLVIMLEEAGRVSGALAKADLRHRFEIYDDDGMMVGYLHHRWPQSL
jgi:hypothetical protein